MRKAIVAVLLLSGCATIPPASVRDADESMVASCRFLGEVHGSSGFGGLAASTGMANAKAEAQRQADALGANRVVWQSVAAGYTPSASGRAYRCGP